MAEQGRRQTPEHVIADAMSEHLHFRDDHRAADCSECCRVIATATRIYQALDQAGLLSDDTPPAERGRASDDASRSAPEEDSREAHDDTPFGLPVYPHNREEFR